MFQRCTIDINHQKNQTFITTFGSTNRLIKSPADRKVNVWLTGNLFRNYQ